MNAEFEAIVQAASEFNKANQAAQECHGAWRNQPGEKEKCQAYDTARQVALVRLEAAVNRYIDARIQVILGERRGP